MTNSWTDIEDTDLVVIMGGNAAEAHPCGFKWVTEAKANRGAKLIVIDPRFTRSASVADVYAPIRQGTDIAFLLGLINYCMQNDKVQWRYVKAFTNATYLVKEGFAYKDGLFAGYDEEKRDYNRAEMGIPDRRRRLCKSGRDAAESALRLEPAQATSRVYTPETGRAHLRHAEGQVPEDRPDDRGDVGADKTMTSMYALGWTQHSKGSQNIRSMAMLQLILGNIGIRGGGMNALRGHSNIQGLTDIGLMSNLLPGYMTLPDEKEVDLATYMTTPRLQAAAARTRRATGRTTASSSSASRRRCGATAATKDNDFAYDYLPKLDVPAYDVLRAFELMHARQDERLLLPGLQPAALLPQPQEDHGGAVEAEVPRHHGPAGDGDVALLGEPRRAQRRRSVEDPDRSDPAADHLLCRGRGLPDQFRPLAAMALAGRARRPARPRATPGSWRRSTFA